MRYTKEQQVKVPSPSVSSKPKAPTTTSIQAKPGKPRYGQAAKGT